MSHEVADVAIIGAGIIGSGIASALSRQGLDVVLIDPTPGLGSTLGNAGLVVPSYSTPMSTPGNLWEGIKTFGSDHAPVTFARPLSLETMKFLAGFAAACRPARVKRDTAKLHQLATASLRGYKKLQDDGLDLGMKVSGWLWLSTATDSQDALSEDAQRMQAAGATCQVVNRQEATELQSSLGDKVSGGIWFSQEAYLDPAEASRRWLADALEHGAKLINEELLGSQRQNEKITELQTASHTVSAKQIVLATGAYSRKVGKLLGVNVPIESGYGWSVTLHDPANQVERALMGMEDHVVISPFENRVRLTGGMRFGGSESSTPRDEDIQALRRHAEVVVPGLAGLEEDFRWQGARPMTASGVPIIKRMGGSNLVVAAGHGPLGVTLAPVTVDESVKLVLDGLSLAHA